MREVLDHFAHYHATPRPTDELIAAVGLEEKARTRTGRLSGGQRRRLAVALGVQGRPELVFLDEPTTGMDPVARRQFWELIRGLRADGTTVLLTTHYLDEAAELADRVGVVAEGRLVEVAPPGELGADLRRLATVRWTRGRRGARGPQRVAVRRAARPARGQRLRRPRPDRHPPEPGGRLPPARRPQRDRLRGRDPMTAVLTDRPAPPSAARIARRRIGLELRLFFRERQQVVFSFAYPVVMMVVFGSVLGGDVLPGGVPFPQYFLAGIAATGIMLSSFQAIGTSIAAERENGQLERLQLLGTPPLAYFAGKAGQVLATTAAQLAILLPVAHYAYDVPLPTEASTVADVRCGSRRSGGLAGTVLGIAASALRGTAASVGTGIAAFAVVLQFFSGVFFAFPELPSWMQQVAALLPLKWLTQGMRSVFLPDEAAAAEVAGSWEHGRIALVLLAWVIIGVVVCVRTFRWRRADG